MCNYYTIRVFHDTLYILFSLRISRITQLFPVKFHELLIIDYCCRITENASNYLELLTVLYSFFVVFVTEFFGRIQN